MRIFSKFTDYYDHVMPPSSTVFWRREQSERTLIDENTPSGLSRDSMLFLKEAYRNFPEPPRGISGRLDSFMFGFCGQLYLVYSVYSVHSIPPTKVQRTAITQPKPFLNVSECVSYYNTIFKDKIKESKNRYRGIRANFSQAEVVAWYNEFSNNPRVKELFLELRTPIFLIEEVLNELYLTVNPRLLDYCLQRLWDPWTTYQEVEMYLSNELAYGRQQMPEFDDSIKRDLHGFDNWSFKRRKGE